ncbi:MAG: metallophosphoesterase [Nocardioidaceae bacterium]|nr:metallophosphoesterase [Nocardioidaceae bacterium]
MIDIRLLLTNDFFGSFARQTTSWGSIPGGDALRAEVDRLRTEVQKSVWLDVGDFAGGGPLSPATEQEMGWAAALELGFDAAVPGNHEFDYGDLPALAWSRRARFPLIAADRELLGLGDVFVPYRIFDGATGRRTAVIGINCAERRGRTVWDRAGDLEAAAERVLAHAAKLQTEADHILVAIHEGVPKSGDSPAPGERLNVFCATIRGHVDAVLGAHTLQRHVGDIAGVPYIQPWALGVEIGILDIHDDGRTELGGSIVPTTSDKADTSTGWSGPGSALLNELTSEIVGHIDRPLAEPTVAGTASFADAVTRGMLAVTGADVALSTTIELGCGQVPLDGVKTYLPAGPVTAADVIRSLPWPTGTRGDELWLAQLDENDVERLTRLGLDIAIPTGVPSYRALRDQNRPYGRTVLSSNYVRNARRLLGRDVEWTPTGFGLRDAFRAWLREGIA